MTKRDSDTNKRPSLLDSFLHDTLQTDTIKLENESTPVLRESKIVPKIIQPKPRALHGINATPLSNDELFLMIDDGTGVHSDENDSNIHVEYRQYYLNKKLDLAVAAAKVSVGSSNAMPKHKSISRKLEFDALRQNCHNKRLIKHLCENINQRQIRHRRMSAHGNGKANDIHDKIDTLMTELQELTNREEALMKKLHTKCERYRNQNNKYMTNLRLKLCIDEVQHNLDVYAKEIIENELELHEIQREIQQKYDILFNLTKEADLFNGTIVVADVHESDDNKTFNTTLSLDKSLII